MATGQSCLALGALGHLDLQVLILIQVAGSVPGFLGAEASASDLPEEGGVLLLPSEPVGPGDRTVRGVCQLQAAKPSLALPCCQDPGWAFFIHHRVHSGDSIKNGLEDAILTARKPIKRLLL